MWQPPVQQTGVQRVGVGGRVGGRVGGHVAGRVVGGGEGGGIGGGVGVGGGCGRCAAAGAVDTVYRGVAAPRAPAHGETWQAGAAAQQAARAPRWP